MRSKYYCIFLFLILLTNQFITIPAVGNEKSYPIIDSKKWIDITFDAPDLIQTCGSVFPLNVTFTKSKFFRMPHVFSATVFLNFVDENEMNKTIIIGRENFIFIPNDKQEITVQIICCTTNNYIENINNLLLEKKTDFEIKSGRIGVRVERIFSWLIPDPVFWQFFFSTQIFQDLYNSMKPISIQDILNSKNQIDDKYNYIINFILTGNYFIFKPLNFYKFYSIIQILNYKIKEKSPLITWEKVRLLDPFICTDKIAFNAYVTSKETDKDGFFTVNVTISNNLNHDIVIGVLIDISDKQILNTFIPTLDETTYNVLFQNWTIKKFDTINESLICKFPEGNFEREKYTINILSGPYIDTKGSNYFGKFNYDIRWRLAIRPKYVFKDSVENQIKELWYNTPIYLKNSENRSMFPYETDEILFMGESQNEKIIKDFGYSLLENYPFLLTLILLFLIPIVLSIYLLHFIVDRIKSKKN